MLKITKLATHKMNTVKCVILTLPFCLTKQSLETGVVTNTDSNQLQYSLLSLTVWLLTV